MFTTCKNVLMFLAAPFIALLYVLLFPFVGFGILAYVAVQAMRGRRANLDWMFIESRGMPA